MEPVDDDGPPLDKRRPLLRDPAMVPADLSIFSVPFLLPTIFFFGLNAMKSEVESEGG